MSKTKSLAAFVGIVLAAFAVRGQTLCDYSVTVSPSWTNGTSSTTDPSSISGFPVTNSGNAPGSSISSGASGSGDAGILVGGNPQSNHLRAVARAAARFDDLNGVLRESATSTTSAQLTDGILLTGLVPCSVSFDGAKVRVHMRVQVDAAQSTLSAPGEPQGELPPRGEGQARQGVIVDVYPVSYANCFQFSPIASWSCFRNVANGVNVADTCTFSSSLFASPQDVFADLNVSSGVVTGFSIQLRALTSASTMAATGTSGNPAANVDVSLTIIGVEVLRDCTNRPTCTIGPLGFGSLSTVRGNDAFRLCDTIDFNNNLVFPEDQDVIDYFDVLAGNVCSSGCCNDIDFNNNGVFPEDQDVLDFFEVLAGGSCP